MAKMGLARLKATSALSSTKTTQPLPRKIPWDLEQNGQDWVAHLASGWPSMGKWPIWLQMKGIDEWNENEFALDGLNGQRQPGKGRHHLIIMLGWPGPKPKMMKNRQNRRPRMDHWGQVNGKSTGKFINARGRNAFNLITWAAKLCWLRRCIPKSEPLAASLSSGSEYSGDDGSAPTKPEMTTKIILKFLKLLN